VQAEWKSRNGSPGTVFQILLNQISAGERDANTRKAHWKAPFAFSWFAQMVLENGKRWIPMDGAGQIAQNTIYKTRNELHRMRGIVVIASAYRTEDPEFETCQGVRL
jgi:hypothetical protein